jgi:glucose/arabinose dehydrogenase
VRPRALLLAAAALLAGLGTVLVVVLTGDGEAKQDTTGTAPAAREPSQQSSGSGAAVQARRLRLQRVGSFDNPVYVTAPPGDRRRLFVVEQDGKVQLVLGGRRASRPFLDIGGLVTSGGERGLLSIAFAPDYRRSGRFYVYYTDNGGDIQVDEFRRSGANPNRANRASRRPVLGFQHPFANHNGGLLLFGPDDLLYIGSGDGGGGGDPSNNAQDRNTLLGKILRIDPRASGSRPYTSPASNPFAGAKAGRDEIYAWGLRNPWRFSFDRANGDLYIGDVGQDQLEEVDYAPRGKARGRNFGWSCFEGRRRYDGSRNCPGAVGPSHQYDRSGGECSVTGGVVVRHPGLPRLRGRYVYGDYCRGQLRSFRISGGRVTGDRSLGLNVNELSSFGEDSSGRVYAVSLSGPVYRLVSR